MKKRFCYISFPLSPSHKIKRPKRIFPVILSKEPEFVINDPSVLEENFNLYDCFGKALHELKVVNGCSEWAISPIQQFITAKTKNEVQR